MKTAIITGASCGIGRAAALELAKNYTHLAITGYHHAHELKQLQSELEAMGRTCVCMTGDIGSYDFSSQFINEAAASFGGQFDLLVNNAGISYVGLLTDMSTTDFDNIMKTNVYSVWNTCRLAVPYMVRSKSGKIINISSVWGSCGASCEVAYSATKGSVNAFSRALAKELAPSGICVNAIAFGAVDTSMNSRLTAEERLMLTDEIPAGRMASPDEAGRFIADIAGCGEYLNGQIITFDGAWQ